MADPGSPDGAAPEAPPPPLAPPLRSTMNPELMANWSLVLEALAIEGQVVQTANDGRLLHLVVAPADHARALAALAAFDRDRRAELEARTPPIPDGGRSAAGLGFVIAIAAFHWVTGPRDGADPGGWFRRGSAIAELITQGQLYRAVTALSLHADWGHVAGNAAAGLIFLSALGRWMGGGAALLATVVAGTLGNLIVAFSYGSGHNSVGASTATFAALGVLGGLQIMRWSGRNDQGAPASQPVGAHRRRILQVVGACLGVFAMLGVGERSDVLAHLGGLAVGLGIGVGLGRFVRMPLRPLVDLVAGLAAAGLLAGAWLLAFR
jgi:rhomboid protease GluP